MQDRRPPPQQVGDELHEGDRVDVRAQGDSVERNPARGQRLRELPGPGLVLVSAGFDAHADDPLASCRVTDEGYVRMAASVELVKLRRMVFSPPPFAFWLTHHRDDPQRTSQTALRNARPNLHTPEQMRNP